MLADDRNRVNRAQFCRKVGHDRRSALPEVPKTCRAGPSNALEALGSAPRPAPMDRCHGRGQRGRATSASAPHHRRSTGRTMEPRQCCSHRPQRLARLDEREHILRDRRCNLPADPSAASRKASLPTLSSFTQASVGAATRPPPRRRPESVVSGDRRDPPDAAGFGFVSGGAAQAERSRPPRRRRVLLAARNEAGHGEAAIPATTALRGVLHPWAPRRTSAPRLGRRRADPVVDGPLRSLDVRQSSQ